MKISDPWVTGSHAPCSCTKLTIMKSCEPPEGIEAEFQNDYMMVNIIHILLELLPSATCY